MAFSKKPLQKKKKIIQDLNNPIEVNNNIRYKDSYLQERLLDEFNVYLYARFVRPEVIPPGYFPKIQRNRNGILLVHIDSVFTRQTMRRHLKTYNTPFSYDTYWKSIETEELNFLNVPLLQAAKDYGLCIRGISTTPTKYKNSVETFLIRHNLINYFNMGITQPKEPWKSESVYLRHILRYESNPGTMAYWWYSQEQYPKIKGSSLYHYY